MLPVGERARVVRAPRIPQSKTDPVMMGAKVARMRRDIRDRFHQIKVKLRALFDARLVGHERVGNAGEPWWFLCHSRGEDPTLYAVNAGRYIYTMTPGELDDLTDSVADILDEYLTAGGKDQFWAMEYVSAAIRDGTVQAATNLAHQSPLYDGMMTIGDRMQSTGVMNQIIQARSQTYSDWVGVSDTARADLTNVLTDAILRGVNPSETMKVISQRLDVNEAKAANIAQTEQVGALRRAQHAEADWARDTLGLNVKLLWLSALKPVTRPWHAARHGQLYTTEEIDAFYAVRGNKYFCYCSQIPAVLNEDGELANAGLAEKLARERANWRGTGGKRATETGRNAPPPAPPKPEPKPRPAPKLERRPVEPTYQPPKWENQKSLPALARYATGRIAEIVKIPAGSDLAGANAMFERMALIQDRFGLPKERYLGGARGDTYRYKTSKNMLAAYAKGTKAVLLTAKGFDQAAADAGAARAAQRGYISASRAFAIRSDNEALIEAINSMDVLPWTVVPGPRGVMAHEYGHVIHAYHMDVIDEVAQTAYRQGWGHALSKYGQTNHHELVAESFALYIDKPNEARRLVYPPLFKAFQQLDKATK